ncbi:MULTISPECIES: glycosyltransferase family A protein [Cyanophyceae]|uniref:glycosyltransferase family 2 protein n=1 Tax=Cyanophyceae TaxID=3028117 RepID=UPI001687B00C|nr:MULTISPECIES: glycosyltransferase family A protein [Cyanophyceae]MBD1918179.1 glycosyltransferase family 2 protein [Phormidium sp. FACHB-77]MBD2030211.1 glycosyltransferase family 2 protein [Phormidium sp. FACHB-322]MBD2051417.1 glycosyltransferase family 2 protein [Leptolyngbya sp. FACHB-60]
MKNNNLVSVVIIFFNGEAFLEEAIASVFAQTYKAWELILVDDGSTDGSTAIAKLYAQQYPEQVRYLEHEGHQNRGMSATRNLGIYHAKGDYIGFLDADDIWLPHKLEQQTELFNRYPEAGMVYGRAQIWHSWSALAGDKNKDYFYDLGVCSNSLVQPPLLFKQLLKNKHQTPTPSNALMRRDVFDQVGLFEEIFRSMYEDQVFFSKIALSQPVYIADQCWSRYRQHPQSCSTANEKASYFKTRQPFLVWLEHYLTTQPSLETEVLRVFQRELWQCHHPRLAMINTYVLSSVYRLLALFRNRLPAFAQPLLQK